MRLGTFAFALLVAFQLASLATAEGWGTIKGKFVVSGKLVPAEAIAVPGGVPIAAVPNEKLIVGPNGELKNVALWLTVPRGTPYPEPHPSYAETANDAIDFNIKRYVLQPHVTFLRTSQQLRFRNLDPVPHHLSADFFANPACREVLPANGQSIKRFETEERAPYPIVSSVYPWMQGYLLIRESPYVAISDEQGTFEIRNVPAGVWTFQFWHETGGFLNEFKLLGQQQNEQRGLHKIEVFADDVTDLGEISIPARRFLRGGN